MKRMLVVLVAAGVVWGLAGCSLFARGEVYVTVGTIGGTLITVKFLAPADNAGSYTNQYSTYVSTVSAAGYLWYVYEVPGGEYDVYIEWTGATGSNGRARVTIDPGSPSNEWAAVYVDTGGNAWGEEGGGTFDPQLYNYP